MKFSAKCPIQKAITIPKILTDMELGWFERLNASFSGDTKLNKSPTVLQEIRITMSSTGLSSYSSLIQE